jgi:calcineurin-like phosphoesterase family protein
MPKTWITADWHLGEDRFEIMQRPFKTAEENINFLMDRHNELVAPDDIVIVNGDAVYQKHPEYLAFVKLFHGRKTLVRGNHDRVFNDATLLEVFEKVVPEGDGIEIDCGFPAYVTHYPTRARKDRFNLVGHIHTAWKVQLNMVNVGVDCNHFRPHDLAKMYFYYQAISDFYDGDVWVAYDPVNASYVGQRGKPGSYFKPHEEAK